MRLHVVPQLQPQERWDSEYSMASTYNPLTGVVTNTLDTVKTSPNLGQFNNAAIPLSDLQQSAADARAAANALKTNVVDPGRAAQQAAADALNAKNALPKKGEILSYREGQPGLRIPQIADGKGGYYFGPPEFDPTYKVPVGAKPGPTGLETTATGSTTTQSLAANTFKNTLALFFGQAEMSKPWVNELYKIVNPYYTSGSSVEEALNMAIQEGRTNPNLKDFVSRFSGIYALQDKLVAGQAVKVPTIAEYYTSEAAMGNVLRQASLGDIATQDYLGSLIGKGLSVTDVGNYVNNIYTEIQNLPEDIKKSVLANYPALDNVSLAKAILTGDKGFAQLQKDLTSFEIQGMAQKQGLNQVSLSDAQNLAGQGYNMGNIGPALTKTALMEPTVNKLTSITAGQTPMTQTDVLNANLGTSAEQQRKLDLLSQAEIARLQGSAGTAKGAFATQYLARTSGAGQY